MFSFLPIHAAGIYHPQYGEDLCCLSDYCVTSYTPTLGTIISSQGGSTMSREDVRLLLAAAPKPCTSVELPAAQQEVECISEIVPCRFILTMGAVETPEYVPAFARTADDVLRLLPKASILHLACHGLQNAQKPLESGFIMQDKIIQVDDLIRLNLPSARLAFLSACETAQGDTERPDEALHLAATMLYAGFKSIVGTMWSMNDIDGPVVTKTVYEELFVGESDILDFDIIPYALDMAVRKLRDQGLEPSRWAPYIHMGM
jgi:CHAT domain-containing protein